VTITAAEVAACPLGKEKFFSFRSAAPAGLALPKMTFTTPETSPPTAGAATIIPALLLPCCRP
jgi:hypothetical protein